MASAWWPNACRSPTAAGNRLVLGFFLLVAAAVLSAVIGSDVTLEATRVQLVTRMVTALAAALLANAFIAPNLLGASERGAQKRTMSDKKTIGAALQRHGNLPRYDGPVGGLRQIAGLGSLPMRDGWNHPFDVRISASAYSVTSAGCDCE